MNYCNKITTAYLTGEVFLHTGTHANEVVRLFDINLTIC
jgi:hypothetical protein